jgi:asparagine synthase (glutamine-hydrolysing)
MCGVLALFTTHGSLLNHNLSNFTKALELLNARGPDTGKIIQHEKHIFGFTRLSINDLSENGMQPFVDGDSILMCNGEIYNHKQLEKKYDIHIENTTSDCACLLPLYKKIGFAEMIEELDGVFSIILYDGGHVYIGRDRIGVRPLFVCKKITQKASSLIFASEAKCLDLFGKDIQQVSCGSTLYTLGTDYTPFPDMISYKKHDIDIDNMDEIYGSLRKLLTSAVSKRLLSDRPVCALLSGGLDSSIITSILCKLLGRENVMTYSIGMEGSPDVEKARVVSEYLGTNHTEVIYDAIEGLSSIESVIYAIESYDITTVRASIPMYLLAQYIQKNSKNRVVFSGEGADEILCGYLYFHKAPTPDELEEESLRLIRNLRYYDVLRADRCISSAGLEIRVPFLDKDFVDYCVELPGEVKGPMFGMEKYILRKAFEEYLPKEIVWRRKDGLSDGVSSVQKPWYSVIEEFVKEEVEFDEELFLSEEAQYYKEVFMRNFKNYRPCVPYWMHKWIDNEKNPSNRMIQL